jgi:putative DNA primase/helicase
MTAASITQALGGRWLGRYGMVRCVIHDDGTSPALKISDDPRKSDGIDVICFAGCDWRHVKAELRKRGLLPELFPDAPHSTTSRTVKRRQATAARPNLAAAAALWDSASPAKSTLVEQYLTGRGIQQLPPTLRYLPQAKHGPSGQALPCMIAAVPVWPSKAVRAVHRTFLDPNGCGKAQVPQQKMMLGGCSGGAVRLSPVAAELGIAEGIETALAAMQMTAVPTWAALSTSGMQTVVLPREARSIVIYADNDTNNAGREAAEVLAARLKAEGRKVRIEFPPNGEKDFNDALLGGAA